MKNLSVCGLKTKFINPYRKGNSVCSNERLIETKNIDYLAIIKTKDDMDVILDAERHDDRYESDVDESSFVGIIPVFDEDIIHYGENVTSKYISSSPGESTNRSKITNQLVIPILVTVIGTVFAAYLTK